MAAGNMNLGALGGASGMADGLQDLIKQRLLQQQAMVQQQAEAERARHDQAAEAQQQQYQNAQIASLADERAAQAEQRRQVAAGALTNALTPGDVLDPSAVGVLRTSNLGSTIQHQTPTLPSTAIAGASTLPSPGTAMQGAATQTAQPGNPEQDVYLGTNAQRVAAGQQAALGRLITQSAPGSRERLAAEYAQSGKTPPAGMFEPKPAGDTAAADDQRFERVMTAQGLHQPVSAEDAAWASAYRARKTLGPALSSSAADERQDKAQNFQVQQAGRAELSNKVEQPYLDAANKADTIRSAVAAARSGNAMAGSLQPLLATLGVTTMEGVKRINSVELQQVAGAGSLWDRIQNSIGKIKDGQPLDPALQDDLVQLADMLQKSAYQKYATAHKAVTTRYGLTDEQPLPAPGGAKGKFEILSVK